MTTVVVPARPNPWRTIWFSPRRTIREVNAADYPPTWAPVIGLSYVASALEAGNTWWATGDPVGGSTARALVIMLSVTLVSVWAGPLIVAAYGRWRGYAGTSTQIRAALVWSFLPTAVSGLFWLPIWIANDWRPMRDDAPIQNVGESLAVLLYGVTLLAPLWSLLLGYLTLAEVQQVSWSHALDSTALLLVSLIVLHYVLLYTFALVLYLGVWLLGRLSAAT